MKNAVLSWMVGLGAWSVLATDITTDTTISGSSDAASVHAVASGATLTVKSRQTGDVEAVLPQTLQDKVVFWLDANTNVTTDANGKIVAWYDARETDLANPTKSTKAIVLKEGSYPSDNLTVSAFANGMKYVDFGEYNENKWLLFVSTDGGDAAICGRTRVAFRAAVGYLGFGSTAGFVFGDVADPTKSGYTEVEGANSRCIFHKGQGGSGVDNIYGPYTAATLGEMRKDGTLVNPFATAHVRNGWELFSQNGPYQVVSGGADTTPFASTLFNQGNLKAVNGYQDRQGGGKVAEMIYFADVLTQAELDQVEAYLRQKWKAGANVGEVCAADGAKIVVDADESIWTKDVAGSGTLEKNGEGTLRVVRNGRLAAGPLTINAGKVVDWEKRVHRPLVARPGKRIQANATTVNVATEGGADVATLATTSVGLPLALGGVAEGVKRIDVDRAKLTLQPLVVTAAEPVDPRATVGRNLLQNGGFEAVRVTSANGWEQGDSKALPWGRSSRANGGNLGASLKTVSTWLGGPSDGYSETTGCPEGDQFALIQVAGLAVTNGLCQTVTVPETGIYRFSVWARARYRYSSISTSLIVMQVYADEQEVLRRRLGPQLTRASGSLAYAADACTFQRVAVEFPLTKGSHVLHVMGAIPAGASSRQADRALDIDDARLELVKPGDYVNVVNSGFDWWDNALSASNTIFSAGIYALGGECGYGWSFETHSASGTHSGIARNIGAWFEDATEDATRRNGQVMLLQREAKATQTLVFPKAGKVRVQFRYCNRWGNNRANGHAVVASLDDSSVVRATVTDATMRLASGVADVTAGDHLLTIKVDASGSTADRATAVDDVTVEYLELEPGAGATVEAVTQDLSETVLTGTASASKTFTTTNDGPHLLTFRLRGRPLAPTGTAGVYQSHSNYTHLSSVTVDGSYVGQLYAQETERRVFELRTPYLATGEHTVVFSGSANQENAVCQSRLSDVTLTPLETAAMMDTKDVKLKLLNGATLDFDFVGTIRLRGLRDGDGKTYRGLVSSATCDFITGTGQAEVVPDGLTLILR